MSFCLVLKYRIGFVVYKNKEIKKPEQDGC